MTTRDEFWTLIDEARRDAEDAYDTAVRLEKLLAARTTEQIYAFAEHQARLMEDSYGWPLWGAAYVINGGCSDDGFDYFRGWLLAQGQDAWNRALKDPDSLADLVDEDDEADCEDVIHAAASAHKSLTGDYPKGPKVNLPDLGESWDFDDEPEMRSRYPRLTKMFF